MDMHVVTEFLPVLGRILIGFFFLFFGIWNVMHRQAILSFMRQKHIPFTRPVLAVGIIWQSALGLLLIIGIGVQLAALLLIPFTLISVFIFHAFWNFEGETRQLNMALFIANLTATLGGLLLLLGYA